MGFEIVKLVMDRDTTFSFGAFEVNLKARELRKRGVKLRLQRKPFQLLELLLGQPGEVVTREELHRRMWPGIHVGFERSLNTAMNALRQVLGDSPQNPRYIETLPGVGYRLIAPVERSMAQLRRLSGSARISSLTILPFENVSRDPELEYLSDGIAESIIRNLSCLPYLRIIARDTAFRYKGRGVDPRTVGRELATEAVLTGRVMLRGDSLIVDAELVQVENGWRLWGEQYSRKPSDIFSIEDEIALEISGKLRLRLTADQKSSLTKRYTGRLDAYQDYLRGQYCAHKLTQDGLRKSVMYLEAAIQKDPNYALAYTGLARTHKLFAFFSLMPSREAMSRAKELTDIALRIDETLAEAHSCLAAIKHLYEWKWASAEAEHRRALVLNPNDAASHHSYGAFLSMLGRAAESIREIRLAEELDPLSPVISNEVAWNLHMARRHDEAVAQSLKTLELEPGFAAAYHTLGLAYEQLQRYEEAISALEQARLAAQSHPATIAALGHAHALAGAENEAIRAILELRRQSLHGYVSPYWLAIVHVGLGDRDSALEALDEAYKERDVWLAWVKVEPRFDGLQTDARFTTLLRRIGLAPSGGWLQKAAVAAD